MEMEMNEQPQHSQSQSLIVNNMEKEGENVSSVDGSLLGKFKDVESLKNAYIQLQREFTKKSQRLSEYEKSDNFKTVAISENNVKNESYNNITNKNEVQDVVLEPQYFHEDWSQKVVDFLKTHPQAQVYAKEISAMLFKDKDLASLPNSLEIAYNKILASKYKSNEDLINDEEFLNNYVYNNEAVKNKIIQNYLLSLQKNKVPTVISASKGSGVGLTPKARPKDLEEARKITEQMFKQ